MKRWIIHIDMDAFFASIEQRDNPAYRLKPVIVGGAKDGRGVVSTASYEARRFGVHSAMSMHQAVQRCPNGIFLPVDMAKYRQVSQEIMAIFHQFTPLVEAVSLDEAFLDVTESGVFGSAVAIGHEIKAMIQQNLELTASIGVASNKFLAKLASDFNKPDGFCLIADDAVEKMVWPLPIKRMMGVGKKTEALLLNWQIKTIGQLAQTDVGVLAQILGKQGPIMHQLANGIDERPVVSDRVCKSVGREVTFQQDVMDGYELETVLMDLTEDVAHTLRKKQMKGKTISLKIRYDDFKSISRTVTLTDYTAHFDDIFAHIKALLATHYEDGQPVRLIGLSVSHLENETDIPEQLDLFGVSREKLKQEHLDALLDEINEKYGKKTITRARQLTINEQPKDGELIE